MEADRKPFLYLLGLGVGVLAILLAFARPPSLKMTVSCAHKGEISSVLADRDILPTNVRPLHYDLTVIPEPMEAVDKSKTTFNFDGKVSIKYAKLVLQLFTSLHRIDFVSMSPPHKFN